MKKLREGLNGMKVLSLPSFSIVALTPKLLQSSQATGEVYGRFHERILRKALHWHSCMPLYRGRQWGQITYSTEVEERSSWSCVLN